MKKMIITMSTVVLGIACMAAAASVNSNSIVKDSPVWNPWDVNQQKPWIQGPTIQGVIDDWGTRSGNTIIVQKGGWYLGNGER